MLAIAAGGAAPRVEAAVPSPAATLRSFVVAAGRGDAPGMWRLLSPASRRRLGPTLARFRSNAAVELAEGAGTFSRARDLRVVLGSAIDARWAVAALSGTRRAEGAREFAAYAVALRRTRAGGGSSSRATRA